MNTDNFRVEARADFCEFFGDGPSCADVEVRESPGRRVVDVRHIRKVHYTGRARRAVPLRENAKSWAGQAPPLQSSKRLRRLFGLGRRGGLGASYQAGEGGGVFHRDVGQDFAIQGDTGGF